MKFVHLTPFKNIKKIKKSGIRVGKGGRDKAVFAVPLTLVHLESYSEPPLWSGLRPKFLGRGQVPSWHIWYHWCRKRHGDRRGRLPDKAAAIIFAIPENSWPVNVSLEILNPNIGRQAAELILSDPKGFTFDETFDKKFYQDYVDEWDDDDSQNAGAYMSVTVSNLQALGKLWHYVYNDDTTKGSILQVEIPTPIPARYVKKIIPLYRSNRRFKEIKDKIYI